MKTKSLILTLLIATLLWSCSEETDFTVTIKESGNLKIELTQNAVAVVGTMVYLMPEMNVLNKANSISYIDYAIDSKETDANGLVDFGEVNAGNYMILTEGVTVGKLVFNPTRIVQVISGTEKEYAIETLDYKGTITITVFAYDEYYDWVPTSGIKVAILPEEDMYNSNSVEDAIDIAFAEKTSNADGIVSFELPSGYYYEAIVYTTDTYGDIANFDTYSTTYLETGEEYSRSINFYIYE